MTNRSFTMAGYVASVVRSQRGGWRVFQAGFQTGNFVFEESPRSTWRNARVLGSQSASRVRKDRTGSALDASS